MSLKTRIEKLENAVGNGERQAVLELHFSGLELCPEVENCHCQSCGRPDHDANCRLGLRTSVGGTQDLIRTYDCWPCSLG